MPEKKATQMDIARRAGVSRAVVSYVINNGPRVVSPETKASVLAAIEELGYRPNKYAQSIKLPEGEQARGQIGIILGGNSDFLSRPYFNVILASIYREANRLGKQVRFLTFFDELKQPVFFNNNIHHEEISGLILIASDMILQDPQWTGILSRIRERIDNIVSLEHAIGDVPAIIFDRIQAARMAVQHLVDLGHKRIAFVGFSDNRLDGYRQVMLMNDLETLEPVEWFDNTLHTPHRGYQMASILMQRPEIPTAIFATSDEVAVGVLAALHDLDINVPEDVALVSIDDIALASMVRPALTTVHVPKDGFATHALRILETHIHYPDIQPASVVLPTKLIIRESCGAKLRER
jgi:LacI family transcriptional regulator